MNASELKSRTSMLPSAEATPSHGHPNGRSNGSRASNARVNPLSSRPDPTHDKRIRGAWEGLVQRGQLLPNAVRAQIEESWRRCHQAGVDPRRVNTSGAHTIDDGSGLRQGQHELADVSAAMMREAKDALAESGTIMVLADHTGVILETQGDGAAMAEAAEIRLVAGADWSELSRGTNGIGTALSVGGPVRIYAAEHYCVGIEPWSCVATVVREPADQHVLGALSVSGIGAASNAHVLALVVTAAGRIEAELARREMERREQLLDYGLARPPGAASGGWMLFDRKGRLVKADPRSELALAAIEIEPNQNPRPRIGALDVSDACHDGNRALPDWLDPGWIEPVIAGGDRLGSLVVLPGRLRRAAVLPRGGLPVHKLRRVQDFVEAHLDRPLTLAQLAAAAAVSPFHFHRQFKRSTGMTPHQYMIQLRIQRAKTLLSASELPLVEVAARVGFADQSHFTSTFRKITSMTPRSYRNAKST
jgi:AraC-like DNA-binding protein